MNWTAFWIWSSSVAKAAVDMRPTILTGFRTMSSTGAPGNATMRSISSAVFQPPSSISTYMLDRVVLPRLQSSSSLSTPMTETSEGIFTPAEWQASMRLWPWLSSQAIMPIGLGIILSHSAMLSLS